MTIGGILGKIYPPDKEKTNPKEPEWTSRLEEWGAKKEIDDVDHAYAKREALQQEIVRRGPKCDAKTDTSSRWAHSYMETVSQIHQRKS